MKIKFFGKNKHLISKFLWLKMLRVILVVKSKLSPWIDSAAFEQMKPFLKKEQSFQKCYW